MPQMNDHLVLLKCQRQRTSTPEITTLMLFIKYFLTMPPESRSVISWLLIIIISAVVLALKMAGHWVNTQEETVPALIHL